MTTLDRQRKTMKKPQKRDVQSRQGSRSKDFFHRYKTCLAQKPKDQPTTKIFSPKSKLSQPRKFLKSINLSPKSINLSNLNSKRSSQHQKWFQAQTKKSSVSNFFKSYVFRLEVSPNLGLTNFWVHWIWQYYTLSLEWIGKLVNRDK